MNFAVKSSGSRILVWLIWFIALMVFSQPGAISETPSPVTTNPLLGVVSHDPRNGSLFPWSARYRWKKLALRKWQAGRRAYRQAKWAARQARLGMVGAVTVQP